MRATVLWVGGVVAALLIAAIVVGVILINTLSAQADQRAYEDCMARYGYAVDEPANLGPYDDTDEYIVGMAARAEECRGA